MRNKGYRAPGLLALGVGTLLRTFDFNGRARRSELAGYFILVVLVEVVLAVVYRASLAFSPDSGVLRIVAALIWLPFIAALFRRAHDIGFSGFLTLPVAPIAVGVGALQDWRFAQVGELHLPLELEAVRTLAVIAFWGVTLWPARGRAGRYGPDPRLLPA